MEALVQKALADALHGFTRAIFAVYRFEGRPAGGNCEQIGTCFAIAYRGRQFLVTAAHVLDQHEGGALGICSSVQTEQHLVPIQGQWNIAKPDGNPRHADPLDFAWHELTSDEIVQIPCIAETALEDSHVPAAGKRLLIAAGFPVSKNRITLKRRLARMLSPKLAHYANLETTPTRYFQARSMSEQTHIAMEREKRSMLPDGATDNTIDHHGLSGGPLIYAGLSETDGRIEPQRVAGIILEGNNQILVALRLSVVLRNIDVTTFGSRGNSLP